MNYKVIKNENEVLKLDEKIRYEFLNSRNRVRVQKILNGYLFVLIISIMVLMLKATLVMIYQKHYLDYFKKLEQTKLIN
jgi:hypothetical protein